LPKIISKSIVYLKLFDCAICEKRAIMQFPKVLVIADNLGRWKASERPHFKDFMTGIESWVYACNGEYCNVFECTQQIVDSFDIVIGNTNFAPKYQEKLLQLCTGRNQSVKWISLIEGCAKEYLKPMSYIKDIFAASDLINVINEQSLPFFRELTGTKAEFIGVPYPVENVYNLRKSIGERKREVFIAPMLLKRWNDHSVARASGLPYFGIEEKEHRTLRNIPKMLKKYGTLNGNIRMDKVKKFYKDDKLEIRRAYTLKDYFHQLSNTYFWVNLDERYTWSRYVLDAAALGSPIITTKSTGHGATLFPELTLDNEFQIDKAINLAKRLATAPDFYKQNANPDIELIAKYSYQNMREKLFQSI
jgi:hypothetical protein